MQLNQRRRVTSFDVLDIAKRNRRRRTRFHTLIRRLLQRIIKTMVKRNLDFHIETAVRKGQANVLAMLLSNRDAQPAPYALARLQYNISTAKNANVRLLGIEVFLLLSSIFLGPLTQSATHPLAAITMQTTPRLNTSIHKFSLNLGNPERSLIL